MPLFQNLGIMNSTLGNYHKKYISLSFCYHCNNIEITLFGGFWANLVFNRRIFSQLMCFSCIDLKIPNGIDQFHGLWQEFLVTNSYIESWSWEVNSVFISIQSSQFNSIYYLRYSMSVNLRKEKKIFFFSAKWRKSIKFSKFSRFCILIWKQQIMHSLPHEQLYHTPKCW